MRISLNSTCLIACQWGPRSNFAWSLPAKPTYIRASAPTMEWDTAAGHAVLVAAGGSVWAPGGVPLLYSKPAFRNSYFIASGTLIPPPLAPVLST